MFSTAPQARGLTLPAQCRLSRRLFWAASGRKQRIQLAVTQQNRQIIYKTAFPSTCRLLTVWTFKYEHNSSVNMRIVCYSDAVSALNETKQ